MMSLEQSILDAVRTLPAEKQLLTHAEKLRSEATALKPRRSGKGPWPDLNITLTAAGIEENQREIFGSETAPGARCSTLKERNQTIGPCI